MLDDVGAGAVVCVLQVLLDAAAAQHKAAADRAGRDLAAATQEAAALRARVGDRLRCLRVVWRGGGGQGERSRTGLSWSGSDSCNGVHDCKTGMPQVLNIF